MKANRKIRDAIYDKRLRNWEVADALKISEATFVRWMRHELPEDRQDQIVEVIKGIAGGDKDE